MKKHGRFVAGVFGASVLLALGTGAFLTANDVGAKEAKAAGETTYSWTAVSGDKSKFKSQGNVDLNGAQWEWNNNIAYTGFQSGYLQLGSSGSPFEGGTLSIDTASLFGSGIGVTGVQVDVASYNATGTISATVDNQTLIEKSNTARWSSNKGAVASGTFENPVEGLLEINLGASDRAYYLHSIEITGAIAATYDHISITGTPTRTDYYVGESFSTDGLTVTAYETAEGTDAGLDVTDEVEWLLAPEVFESTDTTSVDVKASWNNLNTLTTIEEITVSEPATVESLEVVNAKGTYDASESFDASAVTVYANMSDGKRNDVTSSAELSAYNPTLDDFISGTYQMTATYSGVSETFDLNLTATIKGYRDSRTSGVLIGTVTGVESLYTDTDQYINIWINDGTAGIMAYRITKSAVEGELAVGKKIAIEGGQTVYNGLYEVNSLTRAVIVGDGEEIAPVAIGEFNSNSLKGLDSSIVKAEGLTYVSGNVTGVNSEGETTASNITVRYNGSSITLRAPTDGSAVALEEAGLDAWFDKIEDLPFNFVGHLGWYYGPQLAPLSLDDFDCPDFNAVEAFVDGYMHMDEYQGVDDAGGACLTTYPLAKEAFEELSEVQQDFFLTSTYFADAAARYNAWAVANGEALDSSLGVLNSISDSSTWIALGALLGVGAIAGAAIIVANRRRKAE